MELQTVDNKTFDEHIRNGGCGYAEIGEGGDTKSIWNPDNDAEVAAAKATFNTLTAKGFKAFRVDGEGEKGERMHHFDPRAGKVIMLRPYGGG